MVEEDAPHTEEDDPIIEPAFPNHPFGNEDVERTDWHHDLIFEILFECFAEMDPSTIHMDSTARPTFKMNFLEQEASTKLYDGTYMLSLELIF